MKSVTYTIGLMLVILAFLACVISFYFILFGVPLFIIGAILIFISKKSNKIKLISTIVPVVLWIPATIVFLYFYGMTTPETYIIPKDFKGTFRVIYSEKCGIEPPEENGRRILVVPANGILILDVQQESGWVDHEYYLVESSRQMIKVPELYDFNDMNTKTSGVYLSGTGISGGPTGEGSSSSDSPLAIHYTDFFVANSDTSYKDNFDNLDSMTKVQVNFCRQRK